MLVECLGAGGEGEVWTAEYRLSEQGRRPVAVKVLHDPGRDDASWERHADLLRSVSHPGLVRVLDVFTGLRRHRPGDQPTGRFRYVVMDLVRGNTLRDWLAENPDSTLSRRLRTLNNVAAALDEMHSGGQTVVPIAHGDGNPATSSSATTGRPCWSTSDSCGSATEHWSPDAPTPTPHPSCTPLAHSPARPPTVSPSWRASCTSSSASRRRLPPMGAAQTSRLSQNVCAYTRQARGGRLSSGRCFRPSPRPRTSVPRI